MACLPPHDIFSVQCGDLKLECPFQLLYLKQDKKIEDCFSPTQRNNEWMFLNFEHLSGIYNERGKKTLGVCYGQLTVKVIVSYLYLAEYFQEEWSELELNLISLSYVFGSFNFNEVIICCERDKR